MKGSSLYKIPRMGIIIAIAGTLFLAACASIEKSALLGAGIGASMGTGIGIGAEPSAGSALIGLGIGAVVGGAMGYLGHKDKENKELLLKTLGKRREPPGELPMLKAPQATCYRSGEKIVGEEYWGPQIRCRIEKQAVWSR